MISSICFFNVIFPIVKLQEVLGSDLGLGFENVAQIPELQVKNSLFGPEPLPFQASLGL